MIHVLGAVTPATSVTAGAPAPAAAAVNAEASTTIFGNTTLSFNWLMVYAHHAHQERQVQVLIASQGLETLREQTTQVQYALIDISLSVWPREL